MFYMMFFALPALADSVLCCLALIADNAQLSDVRFCVLDSEFTSEHLFELALFNCSLASPPTKVASWFFRPGPEVKNPEMALREFKKRQQRIGRVFTLGEDSNYLNGTLLLDVVPALYEAVENRVLVIHNKGADLNVLRKELGTWGCTFPEDRVVCSMALARRILWAEYDKISRVGGAREWLTQDIVGELVGCPFLSVAKVRHRAFDDALHLAHVWIRLVERAMRLGLRINTVRDLTWLEGEQPSAVEAILRDLTPFADEPPPDQVDPNSRG